MKNIKVPYRNSLQYAEARTSRSLLCVRKRRETILTKHPLLGGGDGDDGRRIFRRPPPPYPIVPRDEISRSGIPLTSTNCIHWIKQIKIKPVLLFVPVLRFRSSGEQASCQAVVSESSHHRIQFSPDGGKASGCVGT